MDQVVEIVEESQEQIIELSDVQLELVGGGSAALYCD
jgi:hypothetical protein